MIEIIKIVEQNGLVFVEPKALLEPYEEWVVQAKLIFVYEGHRLFLVITKPTYRISKDRMSLDPLKEGDDKWALLAEEYVSLCEKCQELGAAIPALPIFDEDKLFVKRRPEFAKDADEAKKKIAVRIPRQYPLRHILRLNSSPPRTFRPRGADFFCSLFAFGEVLGHGAERQGQRV